jgi:cytochrome o ubiquinol oxidase subunit II
VRKTKGLLALASLLIAIVAIYFALQSDKAVVFHPKGPIAKGELTLIITNISLMLILVIPTLLALFFVAWKYRANRGKQTPETTHKGWKEGVLWLIPSLLIAVMAIITWPATHKLDPYKPLSQEELKIQVVALDWKWLFIYPEQKIASLNFVQFPANVPIYFELTADGSPMNSFWIPALSGQIYAMSGMTTPLHLMAAEPGVFVGKAAEINGKGYADMTFMAKSTSQTAFEEWVERAKESPLQLTDTAYEQLVQRSEKNPVILYSSVEDKLFQKIVHKYH